VEREFAIKIPSGELVPEPASPDAPAFTRDGRLTDEGLAALRLRMPYAALSDLERDRRLNRIDDLFTVDLLANYIERRLGRSSEANGDAEEPVLVAPSLILH
jgi:acyl carrier protein